MMNWMEKRKVRRIKDNKKNTRRMDIKEKEEKEP